MHPQLQTQRHDHSVAQSLLPADATNQTVGSAQQSHNLLDRQRDLDGRIAFAVHLATRGQRQVALEIFRNLKIIWGCVKRQNTALGETRIYHDDTKSMATKMMMLAAMDTRLNRLCRPTLLPQERCHIAATTMDFRTMTTMQQR
jgi:hypothetical protein